MVKALHNGLALFILLCLRKNVFTDLLKSVLTVVMLCHLIKKQWDSLIHLFIFEESGWPAEGRAWREVVSGQ